MVGRGTQRGAGGDTQRRSARRPGASSAASSAGTEELGETQDKKEEAPPESELQVAPEGGNPEEVEECLDMEEGGEELEETGGGDEDNQVLDMGEGDEQLEETGEEGDEESFYMEEGDEQPEEMGHASGAEGDEYQQEMSEVDEGGGFDEDQAADDFDQEGPAEEDVNFEEEGDDVDQNAGEGADNEGDDGDADIGWVEELWKQKRTGEAIVSENKTEVTGSAEMGTSQAMSAGEKEEKPEAEAGTGDDKVEDMSTDQQDDALKNKDTSVTTGEETAEEKAKRVEHNKDLRWKWSVCIPPVFTGPCFDKNCFQYRIRIHPVAHHDLRQPSLSDIIQLTHSTRFVHEHSDRVMELFVLGKNIHQLFNKILFSTFCGNHMTITIERRQSSGRREQWNAQLQELIKEPIDFTRVLNTVTFKQKNAYTRRNLLRNQGPPSQNVKHRSLFLHNLPPSIDKNFLRILFPLSQKAGMVNVSQGVRSAVLEMSDTKTAYHHLICFTDFIIDGRDIQMGILDMSQEEALKEYEKSIPGKTVAKSERQAHTVSAKEAQRQEVENTSSQAKNTKENQKTAASSSSSSGDKTSHSKGEEKSAGSKKVEVNKLEEDKREKERKDRERKEREQRERQQREQAQKGRNQRGSKQVPGRRTDGAQQPRRTDRAGQGQQDRQRQGEKHRDFAFQNQFDREFKRQKEAEERELKKIMHEQELERQMYLEKLQMEQFQELERQKLIQQDKEVKMQLLMQEQERQRLAREEAAWKLQELEEQHRREREREQKRKFEQDWEREQIEERVREQYREMERNRAMEQNPERERVHQREQEWERAEIMQNLYQQQRILQEEDQPARKRSRLDTPMHEQGKCGRMGCNNPKRVDPRTKKVHDYCSAQCCGRDSKDKKKEKGQQGKCGRMGCNNPKRVDPRTKRTHEYCSAQCKNEDDMTKGKGQQGKCGRMGCNNPKTVDPRTKKVLEYCSTKCKNEDGMTKGKGQQGKCGRMGCNNPKRVDPRTKRTHEYCSAQCKNEDDMTKGKGQQGGQVGFSAHQPRGGNQRSPARPSATATSGQGLGSPQVPQGMHLKQSLEQEVAKQAEELKRNLSLLEEFQKDPSRVASELIQIDPSLATIRGSGSGSTGAGHRDYGNTGQQHVRGAEYEYEQELNRLQQQKNSRSQPAASLGRQMHRNYEPPSLLGEVAGSFDRGDYYGGNLRQENYNRMTIEEHNQIPMAAMRQPEQDRQLRGQLQYDSESLLTPMKTSGHGGGYRPDFY